jgi:ArsR family transcriptional regulator, virulence genes transcriptional regulator
MGVFMPAGHDMELFKLKAELCKTFSDPKRLIIINELRDGEKQVGELAEALDMPQAVVSRQLAVLRSRGVVTPRREGTNVFYSLTDLKIIEACDLVHQVLLNHLAKNRDMAERLLV